jgi:hypothetical protein
MSLKSIKIGAPVTDAMGILSRRRIIDSYTASVASQASAFLPGTIPERHPTLNHSMLVGDNAEYLSSGRSKIWIVSAFSYVAGHALNMSLWDWARYSFPLVWAIFVLIYNFNSTLSLSIVGMFTGMLLFLLVFRNNQAYSRWVDGRRCWGHIIGDINLLNQLSNSWFQNFANCDGGEKLRECIARYSIGTYHILFDDIRLLFDM